MSIDRSCAKSNDEGSACSTVRKLVLVLGKKVEFASLKGELEGGNESCIVRTLARVTCIGQRASRSGMEDESRSIGFHSVQYSKLLSTSVAGRHTLASRSKLQNDAQCVHR
jgi:hypothetical protein